MAKGRKRHKQFPNHLETSQNLPLNMEAKEGETKCPCLKPSEKGDLWDITCPICMEYPHDAVKLTCSSFDKGCRPYLCGTGYRYSNCLDGYRRASNAKLLCPLCRGGVAGWTVDAAARRILNNKMRSCMRDGCSFVGDFRAMRRHMRGHIFPELSEMEKCYQESVSIGPAFAESLP